MDTITKKKKIGAVLVQGGGIAGTQASLDLANAGYKVYLLDRSEAIGGMMARLDKTFPTGDCATCISSPKFVECARNLNIEILTLSEMENLSGEAGNFHATVKRTPRFVNEDKCTGCGECAQNCPVKYHIYPSPKEKMPVCLEEEDRIKVNDMLDRHKENKGALMPVLKEINSTFNYLPENILKYISQELSVPLSLIYRIATFYSAFCLTPRGRHIISVCDGTTCYVRGSSGILSKLQDELNIEVGETTEDKKFSLTTVRCLGCCSLAPVISVDGEIFGNLKEKDIGEVLRQYE